MRENLYDKKENKNYKQNVDIIQLQVKKMKTSTVFMCIHRMKRKTIAEDKGRRYLTKFYDILKGPLKSIR